MSCEISIQFLEKKNLRKKRKWFSDYVTLLGKTWWVSQVLGFPPFFVFFFFFFLLLQPFQLFVNTSFNHLLILRILATCSCEFLYINWIRLSITILQSI